MSESEKVISIPMSEKVKISDLKFDQDNPNRMSLMQLDRLKASIKRWGDIVPVVTNCELLVADGQQRVTALTAAILSEYVVSKTYQRIKLNNHQLKLVGSYNGLKSGYGS